MRPQQVGVVVGAATAARGGACAVVTGLLWGAGVLVVAAALVAVWARLGYS
jgi:hypothetical protein